MIPLEAKLQNINKLQKNNIKVSVCTTEDFEQIGQKENVGHIAFITNFYVPFCQ